MNKEEKKSIDKITKEETYINLPLPNTEELNYKALSYEKKLDKIRRTDMKLNKEYFDAHKQALKYYLYVKKEYDKLNYVIGNEFDLLTVNKEDTIPDYIKITENDRIRISLIIEILEEIIEESEKR